LGRVFGDDFPAGEERRAMKASQFSDAQKAFIPKQGTDGMPVADVCRKAGISQAPYFNWKKKYDAADRERRRLKQFEDENGKLKRIVADLSLDKEMLQDPIRRKLRGLSGSASLSTRCVGRELCDFGAVPRIRGPANPIISRLPSQITYTSEQGISRSDQRIFST
jgi:putative transposase